jgi:hypothetical protein
MEGREFRTTVGIGFRALVRRQPKQQAKRIFASLHLRVCFGPVMTSFMHAAVATHAVIWQSVCAEPGHPIETVR